MPVHAQQQTNSYIPLAPIARRWPSAWRSPASAAHPRCGPDARGSWLAFKEDLGVGTADVVGIERIDGNRFPGQQLAQANSSYQLAAPTLDEPKARVRAG